MSFTRARQRALAARNQAAAEDADAALFKPAHAGRGNMAAAIVGDIFVNFVIDHQQVALFGDFGQRLQFGFN